ncbi:hypothetical protein A3D14_01140 [Candidatus Saccharibacteria bacterium RIFCSPHIGHO2_02_FULL_47_12]|nr:MAG: hypothetical protein A3D14_01140 [Candidatus Saccharibacteria bacterium RIFCSPHIGHO2_02_FULL_47_12]
MVMVARARQAHHQQKRHGRHQKQTKQFAQVYWPYLPLVFIVIIGLLFNFNWHSSRKGATLPYATSMSISSLLSSTNSNRAGNGSAALSLNSQLNQAAQAKANDMVARNYWSHNTPDGQEPWVFISNAGYNYQKAGENLAYGFLTSDDTVAGWMNSPPHKANLLDSSFTEVGFGFANSSNFNSDGEETVVVAMYGKPAVLSASASPAPAAAQPSQTTTKKSTPAPTPEPTPAPQPEVAKEAEKPSEQPVNTSQTAAVEPSTRSISRIQAFTAGAIPWVASTLTVASIAAVFILALKHGLAFRRMFVRGERFVLHHLAFDATVIAFVGVVITFTQSAGFIR